MWKYLWLRIESVFDWQLKWNLFEIEMWNCRYNRCCKMYEFGIEWVNECIWIVCWINSNVMFDDNWLFDIKWDMEWCESVIKT